MKKINEKPHLKLILGCINGWLYFLNCLKYLVYSKDILIEF